MDAHFEESTPLDKTNENESPAETHANWVERKLTQLSDALWIPSHQMGENRSADSMDFAFLPNLAIQGVMEVQNRLDISGGVDAFWREVGPQLKDIFTLANPHQLRDLAGLLFSSEGMTLSMALIASYAAVKTTKTYGADFFEFLGDKIKSLVNPAPERKFHEPKTGRPLPAPPRPLGIPGSTEHT